MENNTRKSDNILNPFLKGNSAKEKTVFIFYILGFLILALSMMFFQPWENLPSKLNPPDEHARILIPEFICRNGKLPTGLEEEVRIPAYGFSYGLYNAFPYYVQGYVMRFVSRFTDSEAALLYSARAVNVFFGLCMAVVVYKIGRRVFENEKARWLFCFAVTYLPQNIFMHSYVNTDSCCLLSTAMILYGLLCCYRDGFGIKNNLWLAGGIILCALSYYNSYGYILSSILLCIAYFLYKEGKKWKIDWKNLLKNGVFISLIVLLGAGWFFVRSYVLYDGDFLGLATRRALAVQYAVDEVNPEKMLTYRDMGYSVAEMMKERGMASVAFVSFVGEFGSMSIVGSSVMYAFYRLLFILGGAGMAIRVVLAVKKKSMGFKAVFFHLNLILCIIIPFGLLIYYAYAMEYQAQGRYVLPVLVPVMYYMVRGLEQLSGMLQARFPGIKKRVEGWFVICAAIIVLFAVDMVFFKALPLYAV